MDRQPPTTFFDEVTDFLATAPSIEQLLAYHPSPAIGDRLLELLDRNKEATLSTEEQGELQELLRLNHLLKMLKLKAKLNLK